MSSARVQAGSDSNGWIAVPRSHSKALENVNKGEQAKLDLDSVKTPNTKVAQKVFEYAKATLPERTFNHSMRVWNYGEKYMICPFARRNDHVAKQIQPKGN